MKILVTGASGLLGAEICRQLKQEDGNEVWAVDNHSRGKVTPECDKFLELDLTNGASYEQLPTDFDYIYHYAAINGTSNFYERPNQVMWTNMVTDFNMFELATMCGEKLQKFVYASSSEIVSDDPVSPVPEHTDITIKNIHNARWSYRLPKICSENFLFNSKIPFVICRYFNVYGDNSKAGHFVADQITKIKSGVFEVTGPEETRSFCHVEDAVRATIHVGIAVKNDVVNIGNDREITIVAATQIIGAALGHTNPVWITSPGKAGSTAIRRPDISKLKSILKDYRPITFEAGIEKIIANMRSK
jgi:nucleoside-diphosphate-sugar epimerase